MIELGASDNLIGTSGHSNDDAGERNVISGNLDDGVDIYGSGTSGNVVAGNFIGTNATGTAALGNSDEGISIVGPSTSTNCDRREPVYGDPERRPRNVISGNVDGRHRDQRDRPTSSWPAT